MGCGEPREGRELGWIEGTVPWSVDACMLCLMAYKHCNWVRFLMALGQGCRGLVFDICGRDSVLSHLHQGCLMDASGYLLRVT